MENYSDKIFFQPGDLVTIRQDLPNKPIMIVAKKETEIFKHIDNEDIPKMFRRKIADEGSLKGIRCRWFTTDGLLQEGVFNTKDLIKID